MRASLLCCVVLRCYVGKQQKLKELGDLGKVRHRVTELQSQMSKLEQENQQLKQRGSAKQPRRVSERRNALDMSTTMCHTYVLWTSVEAYTYVTNVLI